MRSRLGMFAYYQKRRVGGRTSHLARGDRLLGNFQLVQRTFLWGFLVGVRYRSDLAAISRVWHTKTTKSVSTPGNSSGAAQYW